MSRIADAFLKAGHPEIQRPPLAPGGPPTVLDSTPESAPWNFTDEADVLPLRPAVVHRAAPHPRAALRRNQPEFIELVQRVFRPATAEPIARAVMLPPLGEAAVRRSAAYPLQTALGFGAFRDP